MSAGNFLESLSQRIVVRIILGGRLGVAALPAWRPSCLAASMPGCADCPGDVARAFILPVIVVMIIVIIIVVIIFIIISIISIIVISRRSKNQDQG